MFAAIALIAMVMAGIVIWQPVVAPTSTPILSVQPSAYHATAVNEVFSVNITVSNVVDSMKLVAFQFSLRYNKALLDIVQVKNGTFLEAYAGSPNGGMLYYGPVKGADYVVFAGLILPGSGGVWNSPFPSGSGTLATITFRNIFAPTGSQSTFGSCSLTLFETKLGDFQANAISHTIANGYFDVVVPTLAVVPSAYHAIAVNETFSVEITVSNVVDSMKLVAFQFSLRYNKTLLDIVQVKNGTFLQAYAGSPNQGMVSYGPFYGADYVVFAGLIYPGPDGVWHSPFPSGSGTLATITFKAKYMPTPPQTVASDLTLFETKLGDFQANAIYHTITNGYYDNVVPTLAVVPSAYQAKAVNETFSVDITVNNLVEKNRLVAFQFSLRYNKTLLDIVQVKNGTFLQAYAGSPNGGMVSYGPFYGADYVVFAGLIYPGPDGVWHSPFPSGSGTLATITFKAKYMPTPPQTVGCNLTLFETKLGDSQANLIIHTATNGRYDTVLPSIIGDINSDGKVDIFDALLLSNAFGTTPGQLNWNEFADLNHDNTVDIYDAILLGNRFGQKI